MPQPPPVTTLLIARHGETAWNAQRRFQGHSDTELSPVGLRQSEALATRLAGESLDALYSSDLGRAVRVAEHLHRLTGLEIRLDRGLRERAYGIFEGLTVEEIRDRHPVEYERFRSRDPDWPIPGGESIRAKHVRSVEVLNRLVERHPGGRIAVITHGGLLDSLFRHAVGVEPTARRAWALPNAGLNVFQVQQGQWSLICWGDVAHLAEVTGPDYA